MGKVFAVGVGPGSPSYVTDEVKKVVLGCDVVVGYKYTLNIISELILDKEIYEITMKNQEESYQKSEKVWMIKSWLFRLQEMLISRNQKLWID